MTALTSNLDIQRTRKVGELVAYKVKGNTRIYAGALCKITAAGYLAPMAAEAAASFAGVAYEEVNNTGADGAMVCRVYKRLLWEVTGSGMAQANMGSKVYASDDQTVSTTKATNELTIGKIEEVISATRILVSIDTYNA